MQSQAMLLSCTVKREGPSWQTRLSTDNKQLATLPHLLCKLAMISELLRSMVWV
jgi:hypothetical protein